MQNITLDTILKPLLIMAIAANLTPGCMKFTRAWFDICMSLCVR
ncbi:hypothetical protein [Nostoc sp. 106C]|nr:hypothetical protein [Nostoc sp. 106C]